VLASHSKGRGYRVIAISLYDDDAAAADRLTAILQRGGWPKANRSLVMREALIRLEEELAGLSAEDVFRYFASRLARRAAAPSTVNATRHAAYGRALSSPAAPSRDDQKR
jgi:hypothetical protein